MTPAELLAESDALLAALEERVAPPPEEREHAEEILARYDEVDTLLVAHGFPATSAWWRATFERWYRSGKRQLVDRVGRRGGKSSSLSRLGVVEALYGDHAIPPGDVGTVAIVSTDRAEALGRLRTIEAILDTLNVKWKPCKAPIVGIELVDKPVVFRVFTASIAGVSGFTAIFIICDEVAKWKDSDTGVNPASEVLASIRPTMATQPNARIALSSSPMGRLDAHYDAFEEGETPLQLTAHAPTWEANPTLTENDTRALEPDASTHDREYGAVPQAQAESSLLTEYLIERATRGVAGSMPKEPGHFYVASIDPATRGNAWTFAVGTRGLDDVRRIVHTREWRGTPANPLSPKAVFFEIAADLIDYGIKLVHTDQWAVDALQDSARDAGLVLKPEPWTQRTKAEAYEELLKLTQDQQTEFPLEHNVKQDLLGIRKVLTRNGIIYELATIGTRHADFAPCIAMTIGQARIRATVAARDLTDNEKHAKERRAFLEGRTRDKQRIERLGPRPVTHRFR